MEIINWIPRLKTLCWIFWGKNSLTKSNIIEARQTDFLGVTISSHVIIFGFCHFPDTFRQLRKTKIGQFEAEELAITGEKIFAYLKRKDF